MTFEESKDVHEEFLKLLCKPNRTAAEKNRLRFLRRVCAADDAGNSGLSEAEVGLSKGQALCNFLLGERDENTNES